MDYREKKNEDKILLSAVIILLIIGVLMVYSASSFRGAERYNDSMCFIKAHFLNVLIGLFFLVIISRIDYHIFRWMTPIIFFILTVMLIVVLLGSEFHGSKRSILFLGRRFQPSEFMKIGLIFYFSAIFSRDMELNELNKNNLMVHYMMALIVIGLVFLEPDLGTSIVMFFIVIAMFYTAGVKLREIGKMLAVLIPLIAVGLFMFPYQKQRLINFFGSLTGSHTLDYQVKQSIIGFASGGITGTGYGAGKQKLFFLPEPFSDFILSCFGEEMGFIGVVFLFGILLIVLWRGIRIALRAPDRYGFMIASGITSMILINALVNAGVVVNLLPTTGLPFPFISYGGSSLLAHLIGVGILLNISRHSVVPYKEFTRIRGTLLYRQEGGVS